MLRTVSRLFSVLFVIVLVNACATKTHEVKEITEADSVSGNLPIYKEAIAAAREGRTEKAIELFKKITQEDPDSATAYTDLGLQYLKNKDMDRAEKAFDKSILLDQASYVAYNHRGVIQRIRGDFFGAKDMYLKAIKYKPDYANAHLNIAILFDIYLYDLKQALYHYKKYQSLTGNNDELVGKWVVDLERRIADEEGRNK